MISSSVLSNIWVLGAPAHDWYQQVCDELRFVYQSVKTTLKLAKMTCFEDASFRIQFQWVPGSSLCYGSRLEFQSCRGPLLRIFLHDID